MSKYKITFDILGLLKQYIPDAYCEIVGFSDFEITVTTSKTLTLTDISNIKKRMPFIEVTEV
jgi:hypothetical protein